MAEKIKQPITKGVAKVPVVMQLEALECGATDRVILSRYLASWGDPYNLYFA